MSTESDTLTAVRAVLDAIEAAKTPSTDAPLEDAYLRPPETSRYLLSRIGIGKLSTLRYWMHRGEGPPFRKLNNKTVVFLKRDLDEWIESRLSERRTSSQRRPKTDASTDSDPAHGDLVHTAEAEANVAA